MKSDKPKKSNVTIKKINVTLQKEEPVKLDMCFEDAVKLALNTPIKKSKINNK